MGEDTQEDGAGEGRVVVYLVFDPADDSVYVHAGDEDMDIVRALLMETLVALEREAGAAPDEAG